MAGNRKNYYEILGISSDASLDEITSIYKALAKIYHPDVYRGNKKHASEKMKDINEAYEILKDKGKRKKHDEDLKQNKEKGDDDQTYHDDFDDDLSEEYQNSIKEDWEFASEYYPQIIEEFEDLKKVSSKLAFVFQATVMEGKLFKSSKEVSERLLDQFLEKYFGTDPELKDYAMKAIILQKREIAREINRSIKIMGSFASDVILKRLISKHGNLSGVDNDQYIKKEGVEGFFRLMDNSELTYLVSPKPNREYTIIKLETSKFEVFKEAEGQTFTSFKAMTDFADNVVVFNKKE